MRSVISDLFVMLFLAILLLIIVFTAVILQALNISNIQEYFFLTREAILKESLINLLASRVPEKPYRVIDAIFGLQNCYNKQCFTQVKSDIEKIVRTLAKYKIYWGVSIKDTQIGYPCKSLSMYFYQYDKPIVKVCYPVYIK